MFNPHSQGIRSKERFQRDGPYVSEIEKGKTLLPRKLWSGQAQTLVSKDLGNGHKIHIIDDVLSKEERITYLQYAADSPRVPNSETEGSFTELFYTRDGSVPMHARINQPTVALPEHVLHVSNQVEAAIKAAVPANCFTVLDSAVDIEMSAKIQNGGTIRQQTDQCAVSSEWGCTAFLTFGQTRWLRISKNNAQGTINIQMNDNSVVVLHGLDYHSHYQYQIDELPNSHPIGTHLALRLRYRKPYQKSTKGNKMHNSGAVSSRAWMKTEKRSN